MHGNLFSVFIFSFTVFLSYSEAQQTNLLQRYLTQYFQEYFPSTVRSYTLYGNGQKGPADLHAGLPYSKDTTGKVQHLIYNNAAQPTEPLKPPKMMSKSTPNNPSNNNRFQMNPYYPTQPQQFYNGYQPHQQIRLQESLIMNPESIQAPPTVFEQEAQPQPSSESRTGINNEQAEVPLTTVNLNNDGNAEISIQSTMSF